MADTAWSAWYNEIVPEVPGAPLALVEHHTRRAAIEFCEGSLALRRSMTAIDSQANVGEYDLPAVATGLMVSKILEARWQGKALTPARPDELATYYQSQDWRADKGTPLFFLSESANMIRVVPMPETVIVGAINGLIVACRPDDAAAGLEANFASDHFQAIATGAKARLMFIPKTPYFNPQQAQLYASQFQTDIGDAAFAAFRGGVGSRSRTEGIYR